VVTGVYEGAVGVTPCACANCDNHDMCRGAAEPSETMCLWCGIEVEVARRWAQMLDDEDEYDH
jgi:hypothetical protein